MAGVTWLHLTYGICATGGYRCGWVLVLDSVFVPCLFCTLPVSPFLAVGRSVFLYGRV
jgi:hypothetical protein